MKTKPFPSPCVLNRSHWHADGLTCAILCNELTGNLSFDYTGNNNNVTWTGQTWCSTGVCIDNDNEIGKIPNDNQFVAQDKGSIIIKFKSNSEITDGVDRNIVGGSGNVRSAPGALVMLKYSDSRVYCFIRDSLNVNHYKAYNSNHFTTWTEPTQYSFLWENGVGISLYVNKNLQTADVDISSTSWASFTVDPIDIFNDRQLLTREFYADIEYVYFYNKKCSEELIQDLCENPYAMFNNTDEDY